MKFIKIQKIKFNQKHYSGYDENIAQEIKDIKVELVESLTKERDAALESMRLLLVENTDLKNSLKRLGGL